jgi:hypothetical protein
MSAAQRANTPEQKKAVVERLLAAWLKCPDLRLGQLILNACPAGREPRSWAYNVEDFALLDHVEACATSSFG